MPMCDAYIPTGALEPDAERALIAKITEILVSHEVRRIFDLMDDPQEIYRFIASVPEGQLDDEFIPAINRDILAALQEAEAGKWPDTGSRVWIFTREVPDGTGARTALAYT